MLMAALLYAPVPTGFIARALERFAQRLAAAEFNGAVALTDDLVVQAVLMRRCPCRVPAPRSGFAGFRFPQEVIMVAMRWYLRYDLSYRDVEELLAERGSRSTT